MKLSVIIPVFNDTSALNALLERLAHVSHREGYETAVTLVDDGSEEDCWKALIALKNEKPGQDIRLIRLATNQGQHRATLCGLLDAQGDIIITMDADLQHPPEEIPKLVARLQAGKLDMVYGLSGSGHSPAQQLTSWTFRFLFHEFGNKRARLASSFRAITQALASNVIHHYQQPYWQIDKPLQNRAAHYDSITVEHKPRAHGKSGYTFLKKTRLALNVCYFSNSFFAIAGMAMTALLPLGYGLYATSDTARHTGILLIIASIAGLFVLAALRKAALHHCLNIKENIAEILP